MKVTDQDASYVAALANLNLTQAEQQRFVRDLNSILDYVDRLKELDTTGIPPMTQVTPALRDSEPGLSSPSGLRDDQLYGLRPSLPHEEALANAPESDGTFFLVPKVIER
jgi:aspartyl-tRNA(Asn)/glutamyl-tRNA(Gln) amidotransferase subunit C